MGWRLQGGNGNSNTGHSQTLHLSECTWTHPTTKPCMLSPAAMLGTWHWRDAPNNVARSNATSAIMCSLPAT